MVPIHGHEARARPGCGQAWRSSGLVTQGGVDLLCARPGGHAPAPWRRRRRVRHGPPGSREDGAGTLTSRVPMRMRTHADSTHCVLNTKLALDSASWTSTSVCDMCGTAVRGVRGESICKPRHMHACTRTRTRSCHGGRHMRCTQRHAAPSREGQQARARDQPRGMHAYRRERADARRESSRVHPALAGRRSQLRSAGCLVKPWILSFCVF